MHGYPPNLGEAEQGFQSGNASPLGSAVSPSSLWVCAASASHEGPWGGGWGGAEVTCTGQEPPAPFSLPAMHPPNHPQTPNTAPKPPTPPQSQPRSLAGRCPWAQGSSVQTTMRQHGKSWKMSSDLSCLCFLCLLKAMAALITALLWLERVVLCVPGRSPRHGARCKPLPIHNHQLKLLVL